MKYILIVFFLALGGAMALGAATCDCPCQRTTPEQNRKLAVEFYTLGINEGRFENAEKYVHNYIQHNPWAIDGVEGLRKYIKPIVESGGTKGTLRIARTIADGDYVWLHSQASLNGKPTVFVDIFRFECGKMVEHWDVIQEMVPSTINDHAYF